MGCNAIKGSKYSLYSIQKSLCHSHSLLVVGLGSRAFYKTYEKWYFLVDHEVFSRKIETKLFLFKGCDFLAQKSLPTPALPVPQHVCLRPPKLSDIT